MKKEIYLIIICVFTIIITLDFVVANNTLRSVNTTINAWIGILGNFTYCTAFVSFFIFRLRQIRTGQRGLIFHEVPFHILCLVLAVGFTILGLVLGLDSTINRIYFNEIMANGGNANSAMVGFAFFAICYRTMRAKSIDALVFLSTLIVTLWVNMPAGVLSPQLISVGQWTNDILGVGGGRAITMAMAAGSAALALRVMIGYERGAQISG